MVKYLKNINYDIHTLYLILCVSFFAGNLCHVVDLWTARDDPVDRISVVSNRNICDTESERQEKMKKLEIRV